MRTKRIPRVENKVRWEETVLLAAQILRKLNNHLNIKKSFSFRVWYEKSTREGYLNLRKLQQLDIEVEQMIKQSLKEEE